jgi:hypothetical protein
MQAAPAGKFGVADQSGAELGAHDVDPFHDSLTAVIEVDTTRSTMLVQRNVPPRFLPASTEKPSPDCSGVLGRVAAVAFAPTLVHDR